MAAPSITSEIQICNMALSYLGQGEITSIESPTSKAEEICALHYSQTLKEVLRKHIFNFAKKLAVLTVDGAKTPAHGFSYAYALPNDFVRLLSLGDIVFNGDIDHQYYELSEGYIFTDYANGGSLSITYIYNCTNVTKYDPLFIKLLCLQLASNMAYAFTAKQTLISQIEDRLSQVEVAAAAVAGQEKKPRRIEKSRWDIKRRYGSTRNPKYYS